MTKPIRIAITGMGTICGLGHDLDNVWTNLIEGKSGISSIEDPNRVDESLPVRMGGLIKDFSLSPEILAEKEAHRYDLFIHYALHSAQEALKQAGLTEEAGARPYADHRLGCIVGVGMGGFPYTENGAKAFSERGYRRVSPFFIPSLIPNMAPGLISMKHNLKGPNYSISSACASAGHAISSAMLEIQSGRQDAVVTGGAESVLCNLCFAGFINMKALSKRTDSPQEASRPFDTGRDGFVMGEGAGILILENLEKAKARGAKIYAEVVGYGSTSDAHHITAPHPEGLGASQCMKLAIEDAGIDPKEIGYVNAHGTSTPLGDIAETKAIKKSFGEHAHSLKVSSTKSMTGHLLGAAGGIETIFSAKALYEGVLPPTINLQNQDPECDLDYVANVAQEVSLEYALNNSFGFGGTNSSVVLKKYQS